MATFPFDTDTLIALCRQNDVAKIGLFGSTARGEAKEESDLDFLVEFGTPKSLLDVVRFERQLSESLGKKVDLLTESAISPYIRENILQDLTVIYDVK
ncbi:MAG: nucleotidyltransferase family protein [Chloroflexi bacterium]|nr:nucleotidyltransferase family protein [Chloroflexota bacterium]